MVARRTYPLLALAAAASLGAADVPPVEPPAPVSRIGQLLTDWRQLARRTRSLAVEFTVRERDPIRQTTMEFTGILKVLKKPGVPLQGYYERWSKGMPPEIRAWLAGEKLTLWFAGDIKTLRVLTVKQQDTLDFLVNYLHPFILCLDEQRLQREYRLGLWKQDKWYTYLDIVNQDRKTAFFKNGRLVVENRASETIPCDMPRLLREVRANGSIRIIEIVRWRLDDAKAVRDEDFKAPHGPDWKVVQWPPEGLK